MDAGLLGSNVLWTESNVSEKHAALISRPEDITYLQLHTELLLKYQCQHGR